MMNHDANNKIFINSILLLLSLWMTFPLYAAQITVRPDRNPVNPGESVHLEFSSEHDPDGDPDFSPLHQDFDILNQQRSSNMSMINGSIKRRYSWTLNVMPKQSGNIAIPPISFGSELSQPTTLVVRASQQEPSSTPHSTAQELFLSAEATPTGPYVQQQVIYTLKLYRRVGISQASLSEPEADNAVIEKLGEDSNYTTQFQGRSYTVTERRYAIFPQQSGTLTIRPLILTAQVLTGKRSSDRFFGGPSTRTKRVASKAVTLNVKAAPDSFKGTHWLPAQQLVIQEKWSGDINTLKVGEPLTRTLTLIAKGAIVSQLPEIMENNKPITNAEQGELKTYPDQPVLKEQQQDSSFISLREEKIAYIPSQAGVYHLPAIDIPWWNTETEQMQIARIPAQTLTAVASSGSIKQTLPISPIDQGSTTTQPLELATNTPEQTANTTTTHPFWIWLSGCLAIGWLLTIVYFLYRGKNKAQPPAPEKQTINQFEQKDLKHACANNDAIAAKNALITWGREQFNASNLNSLGEHCDHELNQQLKILNQHLYNPAADQWQDGEALLHAFSSSKNMSPKQPVEQSTLQPLYRV